MGDSPDYSGSCMIALYPASNIAQAIAVPDGLAPEDIHLTVAYVGDAATVDEGLLLAAAAQLAARPPIEAVISGHARFTGGDQDVAVALADSYALEQLRRDTVDELAGLGINIPTGHGYTAHLTMSYLPPDEPSPVGRLSSRSATFAALSVVHGDKRIDFPFRPHPIEQYAREAFAAGWAASGGPMTDRVSAACGTAVQLAVEHADDPQILEVTLDLGRLEGTWALLFQRREHLITQYTAAVADDWRNLIRPRLFRDGLYQLRAELGLIETGGDPAAVKAAAGSAALSILQALPDTTGWAVLRQSLRNALAAGRAEGLVGAVAAAAEQAGRSGLDWDVAFRRAYQQLERLSELWSTAEQWLQRLLQRATADLADMLATQATDGDSYEDMLDGASELLDGDSVDAVDFTTDWAMTAAMAAGAVALYQAQDVQVSWVTAGDGRVCLVCDANESGGPYTADAVPECPAHPRCRCLITANLDLSGFADWFTT